MAVVINRPFRGGCLLHQVSNRQIPPWAGDYECVNSARLLLKLVISRPAVTCAIPATCRMAHMAAKMGALHRPSPTAAERQRMVAYSEGG